MHTSKEETNMKSTMSITLGRRGARRCGAALRRAASAQESSYGPADAKEVYYWISNKANLPLFVQYDYPGMQRVAEELGVKVIVAGPTDFDIPGFIAAVDQVCAQKPQGVIGQRRLGSVADGIGQEMHGTGRADRRR